MEIPGHLSVTASSVQTTTAHFLSIPAFGLSGLHGGLLESSVWLGAWVGALEASSNH